MTSVYKPGVRNAALFLALICVPFSQASGGELNSTLLTFVPGGLLVLYALKNLAFAYTVTLNDEGVVVEDYYDSRTVPWNEIERVVYKPSSVSSGYCYSSKIVLKTATRSVCLDGNLSDYDSLCERLEDYLQTKTSLSLEKAKSELGWRSLIASASAEDTAEGMIDMLFYAVILFGLFSLL